jgi:hypothetical protein
MRYLCLSLLLLIPAAVYGGQIPAVDGIIGGVGNTTEAIKPKVLGSAATTPGKLRFKQNSGICGTQQPFLPPSMQLL